MTQASDHTSQFEYVEPNVVAELAGEGAGLIIYGVEDGPDWLFWGEASRYDVERGWLKTTSQPSDDLLRLLPQNWISLYPVQIHPLFRSWFQPHYEEATLALNTGRSLHHEEWMRCLLNTE